MSYKDRPKKEYFCAQCGASFLRYPMNKTRAAKPQYCSRKCLSKKAMSASKARLSKRLWRQISIGHPGECWPWNGRLHIGYGVLDIRSEKLGRSRPHLAHRLAYAEWHGEIDPEMEICHKCDNPRCCNPFHLFQGTHQENMRDMAEKGRANPPCFLGEEHPKSKLTEAQVIEIFSSQTPSKTLAARFDITKESVNNIRFRRTWRHVTGYL